VFLPGPLTLVPLIAVTSVSGATALAEGSTAAHKTATRRIDWCMMLSRILLRKFNWRCALCGNWLQMRF